MNKEGDDDETEGSLLVEPPSGHVVHTPLDIAKGLEDTPVQPQNIDFPRIRKMVDRLALPGFISTCG